MGSITYDFLADSLFFNDHALETGFKNESESRILKEIEDYRNHCIKNQADLIEEITKKDSALKVFSSSDQTPHSLLKQTALYIDQFIINDPLFKQSNFQSESAKVTGKYLGYEQNELNVESILKASKFLKELTPMVVADYVKIFPLSFVFEPPEALPINLPIDNNNGILPKPILDFFWENAIVKSMIKHEKGGWIISDKLFPCRGIHVEFKNANTKASMLYHLFQVQVTDFDKETGHATMVHTLPDTPPDNEQFSNWLIQSVNSAARAYFDRIFKETYISSNLNSTYLCSDGFTNELLKRNFDTSETISSFTASQVMNLELPFFEKIDIQKLMDIRNYEQEIFTNFRLELEKNFRELRNENDPTILKQKSENVFHELNEVQGQKIRVKIDQLRKQRASNTLIGIAGLASSIHTSGFSLVATAIALGKGYKDHLEYVEKVKHNPAYLLWKVKK